MLHWLSGPSGTALPVPQVINCKRHWHLHAPLLSGSLQALLLLQEGPRQPCQRTPLLPSHVYTSPPATQLLPFTRGLLWSGTA
jgi:hypothetical protein